MKPYGAKRTYGGCHTSRPTPGGKIDVTVVVKNRKRQRVEGASTLAQDIIWERWARDRLAFLNARMRDGIASDNEVAEADGLRCGLSAGF